MTILRTPQVHIRFFEVTPGVYQSVHGVTNDDNRRQPSRELPLYTRRRAKRIVVYGPTNDNDYEESSDDEG